MFIFIGLDNNDFKCSTSLYESLERKPNTLITLTPITSINLNQEKPINKGKKENHRANINSEVPTTFNPWIKKEAIIIPKIPPAPSGIEGTMKCIDASVQVVIKTKKKDINLIISISLFDFVLSDLTKPTADEINKSGKK